MDNKKSINIKLKTTIVQDDELDSSLVEELGEISELNDRYIIQFVEKNSEGNFLIRFDILKEGGVLLNRQSDDRQIMSDFYFEENKKNTVVYKTTFGVINLISVTKKINIIIDKLTLEGNLSIDYSLIQQEKILGEYNLQLIFGM